MMYNEILECLDHLEQAWRYINDAVDVLSAEIPVHKTSWNSLKQTVKRAEVAIASERKDLRTPLTAKAVLSKAADFFGPQGVAEASELTLDLLWGAIKAAQLSDEEQKFEVVKEFDEQLTELKDARFYCLTEIRELDSDSTGVAAGNVSGAIRDAADELGEDITTYPLLTQEIGYSPSPLATPTAGTTSLAPGAGLGAMANKAINDVLGWKLKSGDVKGFLGALNASFTCKELEGRSECTWTPRTYAVATDLSGGITGAQASIYSRAQKALELAFPLLDGLYTLDPTTDPEDVDALRKVARDQMNELVAELGMLGGPRIWRVAQYFDLLLGTGFPLARNKAITSSPDSIKGTLGALRDILGLQSNSKFVNSIEDEQDLTNFRILSDYMTSLAQSWVNDLEFFMSPSPAGTQPFFGTQLVFLSRQLSVIAESVDEVRFAMDSVFIGPSERQTLEIALDISPTEDASFSMYVEDLLSWTASFAAEEGPRLIQDGGKYAVGTAFSAQAANLANLVGAAIKPVNVRDLPKAYFTGRVQAAWRELAGQLNTLANQASRVDHPIESTAAKSTSELLAAAAHSSQAFYQFARDETAKNVNQTVRRPRFFTSNLNKKAS